MLRSLCTRVTLFGKKLSFFCLGLAEADITLTDRDGLDINSKKGVLTSSGDTQHTLGVAGPVTAATNNTF